MNTPGPARTGPRTVYAVYHRTCGHVIGVENTRGTARRYLESVLDQVAMRHFRIRVASDRDFGDVVRGVRCATCSFDGQVTP